MKILEKQMLDDISEKEITTREGLERIDYMLNELYWCHNLVDSEDTYNKKQYVNDYFHRLLQELKSLTNISSLLETYPSPYGLKDDIEATLTTLNDIYYNSETFNLNDENITEMKALLNSLLYAVYVEIGNRMCEE